MYDHKLSRCRFHQAEAIGRAVDQFWITGVGFPGWREDDTVEENVRRICPDAQVLHTYKAHEWKGFNDCPRFKSVSYNEAWPHLPGKALEESLGMDLVICHHHNDMECFKKHPNNIFHIRHCAERRVFWPHLGTETPLGWKGRQQPLILTGVLSPEVYPARSRVAEMIRSGQIEGRIRPHMGGREFTGPSSYRSETPEQCERQFADYARDLRLSRVSVCTSSKYKYLLAKVPESLMAGCLVSMDEPCDPSYGLLRGFVVGLPPFESSEGWAEKAVAGHVFALANLTMENYAKNYLKAVLSC